MNETSSFTNWESVRKNIFLRLVNYERNKEVIEETIYIKFLDLAILFYCDCRKWGFDGCYISKEQILMWNKDIKEIFQTAQENTYCENNTLVTSIMNFLPQEAVYEAQDGMDSTDKVMMVLTNKLTYFGAAMLLNISELEKLADQLDSSLYLLPSSVHEVLAIGSDSNTDIACLTNMVTEINSSIVESEEYLSDQVYYFDREKCEVTIAVPTWIFNKNMEAAQ